MRLGRLCGTLCPDGSRSMRIRSGTVPIRMALGVGLRVRADDGPIRYLEQEQARRDARQALLVGKGKGHVMLPALRMLAKGKGDLLRDVAYVFRATMACATLLKHGSWVAEGLLVGWKDSPNVLCKDAGPRGLNTTVA